MSPEKKDGGARHHTANRLAAISIGGFKSICEEQRIEIRPLTLLAGPNSSGKSSAIQPLLLLKQTLEAIYDPGALLLDGPNVYFTSADQLLSRGRTTKCASEFRMAVEHKGGWKLILVYKIKKGTGLMIDEMQLIEKDGKIDIFRENLTQDEIKRIIRPATAEMVEASLIKEKKGQIEWTITREKCFLWIAFRAGNETPRIFGSPSTLILPHIHGIIHLPGHRGLPVRIYPRTAVGFSFPGLFQHYMASVIYHWKDAGDERLKALGTSLEILGLTWKVNVAKIEDTQVELQVGRLTHAARAGARDLVSIADVGFGVSQVLPVVVALLAAEPGQIVYIEQPEIHLHPRAQVAMAQLLADAANRGVIVIAETHSAALLFGVQALVAERRLKPNLVILHWFERDKDGFTKITSRDLDEAGAYGDWPEDFGQVSLDVQSRILDA